MAQRRVLCREDFRRFQIQISFEIEGSRFFRNNDDLDMVGSRMMRRVVLLSMVLVSSLATGCRSCFLLNPYANMVDDINDTHIYFDDWYFPRLDISRAGRPDWCGPINRRLGKNICYLGCYDRYDDCNLYPPSNPYSFPSDTMPPPKVWTPSSPLPTPPAPVPDTIQGPAPGLDQ